LGGWRPRLDGYAQPGASCAGVTSHQTLIAWKILSY
jgi:hypothetical protein